MAEETATPNSPKKNRIIHWNPDAGREPVRRRWSVWRVLAWTVGGFFGLLFAAGIVIRAVKLVWGPEVFQSQPAGETPGGDNVSTAFVSQSKAELAHETAAKALAEVRRMPTDHPIQLQQLILIEKAFLAGESLLASHAYRQAFAHFTALNREIDEFGRLIKIKHEAQLAYDTILIKIKDLEIARSLAPAALEAAFAAAGAGRQFLNEGSFVAAKRSFDDAFAELKKTENALARHIEGSLWRGQQALTKGARNGAVAAFQAALEKAPSNEAALQGLKRAETIDRVHALLQRGENLETQGRYAPAAEAYGKAFSLDKFSATAQEGKARAERLARETAFNSALSAANTAVAERNWDKAIQSFEAALKVDPLRTEVRKALAAAKESAHRDAVQKALAKAFDTENKYMWNEARAAYYAVLQLDPGLAEAKEGYTRAGRVIRALLEFEKLIESSEQKATKAEFQAAIRAFNQAMAVKPSYLTVPDKIQQLRALLLAQNVPVEVTFKSDGKTFVTVTNFRMLAKFETTTVKILPGDYEIVGRRKGYQDVLMLLQVRNGSPPPLVTVACRLPAQS